MEVQHKFSINKVRLREVLEQWIPLILTIISAVIHPLIGISIGILGGLFLHYKKYKVALAIQIFLMVLVPLIYLILHGPTLEFH